MRSVAQLVRHDLRYFGLRRTVYDVFVRALNRAVVFKSLIVLKIVSVDSQLLVLSRELEARFLTELEMRQLVDEPAFEVSESFLEDVFEKGDACFGIFDGETLVSFGWYSTKPTATSDDLTIMVPGEHVYLYKAFTRAGYRGRRLLAIGATLALREYLALGYTAFVSYIESNNFSSLNAFSRTGAVEIGRLRLIKWRGNVGLFASRGLERGGVRFARGVHLVVEPSCA
jgi:hypothetical protein